MSKLKSLFVTHARTKSDSREKIIAFCSLAPYSPHMIPFEEIDSRLHGIGKDRVWLAEKTPYSADYLRTVLAPKSTRRTERVQQIISDAIEKEEVAQRASIRLPDQLALAPTADEFEAWDRASRAAKAESLKDWAIDELNKAAAEWQASRHLKVAEIQGNESPHSTPAAGAKVKYPTARRRKG